ncbi:MAG: hypothetical protein Q8N82_01575, partial [Deltaproteobacteria bacterium]|nr:hypothetical protein [Deltaproteobacteria bacterium]
MVDYRTTHDDRLRKWSGRIVRYWPQILSIAASFATLTGLYIAIANIENKTTLGLIYVIEISI